MNNNQFVMPGFTDMWTLETNNKPLHETISDIIDYEMYFDECAEVYDLAYTQSFNDDAWMRLCYPNEEW